MQQLSTVVSQQDAVQFNSLFVPVAI